MTSNGRVSRNLMVFREGGREIEEEVLGKPLATLNIHRPPAYVNYPRSLRQALVLAQKTPWKSHQPNTPLARQLYTAVKKSLVELIGKLPNRQLELWPTHGTTLDFYHGVDAVFLLERRWWVSLDLSTFEKDSIKADFLVLPERFKDPGYLEDLSADIANLFFRKKIRFDLARPLLL